MNRYDAEEMILTIADIVVENRQLRQEVKDLEKWKKSIMIILWGSVEKAKKR